MKLSVLDLASVYEGMTHGEALRQTIATAQEAERLGYRRFWVAEHHGMPAVASSAPPVLIGAIAAATSTIGSRVVAVPGLGDSPELWLLGSSDFSARLAGLMGLPFAFAHHFAGGPDTRTAFQVYRDSFTPSVVLHEPHSMVAVSALIAESSADAERLMLPGNLGFLRMRQGARPSRIPTLAEAEAHPWTEAERGWAAERNSQQAIGDLAHAQRQITDLVAATQADEVIVVPQGPDLATKFATLSALAGLEGAQG